MNILINLVIVFFTFIFVLFMLFLIFYRLLCKKRKLRKNNIINYVLNQCENWSNNYKINQDYSIDDLYSRDKMYNTGVGNNGSNLEIYPYSSETQWYIKK